MNHISQSWACSLHKHSPHIFIKQKMINFLNSQTNSYHEFPCKAHTREEKVSNFISLVLNYIFSSWILIEWVWFVSWLVSDFEIECGQNLLFWTLPHHFSVFEETALKFSRRLFKIKSQTKLKKKITFRKNVVGLNLVKMLKTNCANQFGVILGLRSFLELVCPIKLVWPKKALKSQNLPFWTIFLHELLKKWSSLNNFVQMIVETLTFNVF